MNLDQHRDWDREEADACFETAEIMIDWIRSYGDSDPEHSSRLLARIRQLAQPSDTSTRPKGE